MKKTYAIELNGITKKFDKLIANDDINLKIEHNSIHAIIGENGAGKSTLMNQIFGLLTPTSGRIKINGKLVNISSPNEANNLGLSMVHQHFQLVGNHSILENIILDNADGRSFKPINFKQARHKLLSISKKYKLEVDPEVLVKNTSVGVQQRIEILKMLYRGADILIFDEPTAMLTHDEIDGLLSLLIDLKNKGKTIIFISHKLHEVKKVADNATILRRGKVIKNFKVKDVSIKKMAEYMVGRKLIKIKNNLKFVKDKKVMEIRNLSVKNVNNPKAMGLKDFNIDLYQGEILAIAGVEGNGQAELVNTIFGLQKQTKGSIRIKLPTKEGWIIFKGLNVNQRYKNKVALVPEDRYKYAIMEKQNLFLNAILQTFKVRPFQKFGLLMKRPRNDLTEKIVKEFDVRGSKGGSSKISELSGGNQQKFVVGRELIRENHITILFQPTRGLDIGAIEFIHQKTLEEKKKGNSILLVSYELEEVISLSDRIAVLSGGNLINVANTKDVSKEEIGRWMAGVK